MNEKELMKSLEISSTQQTYYYYKNHRYARLSDAISYAEILKERQEKKK